jgi:hypothetical protein
MTVSRKQIEPAGLRRQVLSSGVAGILAFPAALWLFGTLYPYPPRPRFLAVWLVASIALWLLLFTVRRYGLRVPDARSVNLAAQVAIAGWTALIGYWALNAAPSLGSCLRRVVNGVLSDEITCTGSADRYFELRLIAWAVGVLVFGAVAFFSWRRIRSPVSRQSRS